MKGTWLRDADIDRDLRDDLTWLYEYGETGLIPERDIMAIAMSAIRRAMWAERRLTEVIDTLDGIEFTPEELREWQYDDRAA